MLRKKIVHDDYYTRKHTWNLIKEYIPKDKILWEACLLNSNEQSKTHLIELGFNVVGDKTINILEHDMGDVIVTNIPFSIDKKKQVMKRIAELNKPFIIIMNSTHIYTKYFKDIFGHLDLKYIMPSKKIHYDKYDGETFIESKNKTPFYTTFVTYNIIDKNIII